MNSSVTMLVAGDYRLATPVLFAELNGRAGVDYGQRRSPKPLTLPSSRNIQIQLPIAMKSQFATLARRRLPRDFAIYVTPMD